MTVWVLMLVKYEEVITPGPVFTKLFGFRIKIRLTFQNEYFLDYFPLSVQGNMIGDNNI